MDSTELSKQITLMRGQCWHEAKHDEDGGRLPICKHCDALPLDVWNNDYEYDANQYMMLFRELPFGRLHKLERHSLVYWSDNASSFEYVRDPDIGRAVALAWRECFTCEKCKGMGSIDMDSYFEKCFQCTNGSTYREEKG